MKEIERVILSGGGTGGHIYPALSIYQALKKHNPSLEVLYIGTAKGLEAQIVPQQGLPFKTVEIQGIQRKLTLDNLKSLWYMLTSTHKAKKIIRDFNPDLVIGTGGYACAPVVYAASQLGIPTFIHEQNSVVGLTNKFLGRYVDSIGIAFQGAANDFKNQADKLILTGNPRGQEVLEYPKNSNILSEQFGLKDDQPTVLVFGGSRGAPAINSAALEAIDRLKGRPYQVIIATGRDNYKEVESTTPQLLEGSETVKVVPYIDNMPAVFQAIDLVICRSGATTLTEILALGLPSILIPSPYVTNNHQEANALALVEKGAATMIKQADLTTDKLFNAVDELMGSPERLNDMSEQAKSMAITDSLDRIMAELDRLVQ